MFKVDRIIIDNKKFFTYEIHLPKSKLLIIANDSGYITNRKSDVALFDSTPHLRERHVACAGTSTDVTSISEMLDSKIVRITEESIERGMYPGMLVIDALKEL